MVFLFVPLQIFQVEKYIDIWDYTCRFKLALQSLQLPNHAWQDMWQKAKRPWSCSRCMKSSWVTHCNLCILHTVCSQLAGSCSSPESQPFKMLSQALIPSQDLKYCPPDDESFTLLARSRWVRKNRRICPTREGTTGAKCVSFSTQTSLS